MDLDLNSLQQAFDLAKTGFNTTGAAVDVFGKLKAALNPAKPSSEAEVKSIMAELADKIGDAKLANAELKSQLAELLMALQNERATKAQLDRYRLGKTQAGSFVYALRQEKADGEPMHYCCVRCLDEKAMRSVLQPTAYSISARCVVCESVYKMTFSGDWQNAHDVTQR